MSKTSILPAGDESPELLKKLRSLADVAIDEEPLIPWTDKCAGILYQPAPQARCLICKSHLCGELEHVYWGERKAPMAVVHHLEKRWGVGYSWDAVKQHMENHVIWGTLRNSGIGQILGGEASQGPIIWKSFDLCVHGTLMSIDEIKAAEAKGLKAEIAKAKMLSLLFHDLAEFKEKRDVYRNSITDVGQVLMEIWEEVHGDAKQVVLRKMMEIEERIRSVEAP